MPGNVTAIEGPLSVNSIVVNDLTVTGSQSGGAMAVPAWGVEAFTGSWIVNTTYVGKSRLLGNVREFWVQVTCLGVLTPGPLVLVLPWAVNESLLAAAQHEIATGHAAKSGAIWTCQGFYVPTSNVMRVMKTSGANACADVTRTVPFTFGAGDTVLLRGSVAVL